MTKALWERLWERRVQKVSAKEENNFRLDQIYITGVLTETSGFCVLDETTGMGLHVLLDCLKWSDHGGPCP